MISVLYNHGHAFPSASTRTSYRLFMSESIANPTEQVTKQNQRLFNRYAQIFHQADPQAYITHAMKLSAWLRDYKAYYDAARPEVRESSFP